MVLSPVRILKPNLYESGCVLYLTEDSVDGSTWEDLSGYKNHGTINGATLVSGSGLYFDGTDDYIDIVDNDSLDMSANKDITIFAKFKTTQNYVDNDFVIVDKREKVGSDWKGYVLTQSNNNYLKAQFYYGSNSQNINSTAPTTINDNLWHSAVIVFDRDNVQTLYLDGEFKDSDDISSYASTNLSTNNNLKIGQKADTNSSYHNWKGYIKEVYIYNKPFNQSKIFAHNRNSRFLPNRVIV